jgi:hypothetical protein
MAAEAEDLHLAPLFFILTIPKPLFLMTILIKTSCVHSLYHCSLFKYLLCFYVAKQKVLLYKFQTSFLFFFSANILKQHSHSAIQRIKSVYVVLKVESQIFWNGNGPGEIFVLKGR